MPSRSAHIFLQRLNVLRATGQPAPRLAPRSMLVHFVPLPSVYPQQETRVADEGNPAPDRGALRPWMENTEDGDSE